MVYKTIMIKAVIDTDEDFDINTLGICILEDNTFDENEIAILKSKDFEVIDYLSIEEE